MKRVRFVIILVEILSQHVGYCTREKLLLFFAESRLVSLQESENVILFRGSLRFAPTPLENNFETGNGSVMKEDQNFICVCAICQSDSSGWHFSVTF